jgi:2-keto-3-deoxy-L-rhamnonate aldolase RhmA
MEEFQPVISGERALTSLRERIRRREPILGTFLKSASHHVAEVLGRAGLDFIIADAEHAPFGIGEIDRVVLGARSANIPCFVRPADHAPALIGQCLDLGAEGIVAPHVIDGDSAADLVAAMKYAKGRRGFSPSTRTAGFGGHAASMHRIQADARSSLWCQIEDESALSRLDDIARTDGVDCLFVGRADLAMSLGAEGNGDSRLIEAVATVAEAAKRNAIAFGIFITDTSEIPEFLQLGASVFVCGSDQSYLIGQGRANRSAFAHAIGAGGTVTLV